MAVIYLSSPYSHPDPAVREKRFEEACRAAARLMRDGHIVFCPVAHSHPISRFLPPGNALDFDFWMHQDLHWVARCDRLVALTLEGWQQSRGMEREMRVARQWGRAVEFLEPE